ncbi:calsyntenin-1-like isoform X2 [Anneissia japonica]|uniref:calsyntenin-1-like isoform X2 n=1 Tax=Anneissia japonica TaxID=1529436 RepID=UPI0014257060|nr:calsyntenin-1-like isoform X2 [Anneissia japonica]
MASAKALFLFAVFLHLDSIYCQGITTVSTAVHNSYRPYIEDASYHGEIDENTNSVNLHPHIFAKDDDEGVNGQICAFHVLDETVPFRIDVVDKITGQGNLVVLDPERIDCERQSEWKFEIQAGDCGNIARYSHKSTVHIVMADVNDNKPYFSKIAYEVAVDEGELLKNFTQVEALDDDCSAQYSAICEYEIITPDVPFIIDNKGRISSTKPLNPSDVSSHVFSVAAYDCGNKKSDAVTVTVTVNRLCVQGIKGLSKRIEYMPDTDNHILGAKMFLELCAPSKCNSSSVSMVFEMETDHIVMGCDRDTYSVAAQRQVCNAPDEIIDLLPTPNVGEKWTEDLQTDEGHENTQVYKFNGEDSQVSIPDKFLPSSLNTTFSISTWMKHAPEKDIKETILCYSDAEGMNRHHMALYIHNCRLVLLVRRHGDDPDDYRPAEWRWKLSEACDKEWHHYVVNVDLPEVKLYVDGHHYAAHHIVTDRPLHPTAYKSTLTVGAAWEGALRQYIDHFNGYLTGLAILPGKTESKEVISCIFACKERLTINKDTIPMHEITQTKSGNRITIKGPLDENALSYTMQQIGYINERQYPTPGQRPLTITTKATCDGQAVKIRKVESYLMVVRPSEPTIILSGSNHIARMASDLVTGILPLSDISIITQLQEVEEIDEETGEQLDPLTVAQNLDSCSVVLDSLMLSEHESLTISYELLEQFNLKVISSSSGLIVKGIQSIENYEEVLHDIIYTNDRGHDYRIFTVQCTELNGRYVSNEFMVQLTILHKKLTANPLPKQMVPKLVKPRLQGPELPNELLKRKDHMMFKAASNGQEDISQKITSKNYKSTVGGSSSIMTALIVICVGFLAFVVFLGLFRIYMVHRNSGEEKQDMDWDDMSLNITINPMDPENAQEVMEDTDSSEDEDESANNSDESEAEEEEEVLEPVKGSPLEWDDGNLKM